MDESVFKTIGRCLPGLGPDLLAEIAAVGVVKTLKPKEFLIRQHNYVRQLPILIEGLVKVYSEEEDVQFLLYYLRPGAACIFSFAQLSGEKMAGFSGVAKEKSLVLLIPVDKVREWLVKYPAFSTLTLTAYQQHYEDLLNTTKQIICYNLEDRLIAYLKQRETLSESGIIIDSHLSIANDMGTSREVISRLLKKLEKAGLITQDGGKIMLNKSKLSFY